MVKIREPIKIIGAALVIGVAALLIYRLILFPPARAELFPWASDTQGHLLKVEYLGENLEKGNIAPQILPNWYMGMEFMRYYPPLPYYLLLGLKLITKSTVLAANWFIVLCALAGGVTWLLYRRWIGFVPAIIGGILFLYLPDNVRVALSDGNLPRVLATALLPITIFLFLRSLEKSGNLWHRVGLALCFVLIVLSHVMMAAIFAICCGLLGLLIWLKQATTKKLVAQSLLFIILGIVLSAWWMIPSLFGGITELNAGAMTEALEVLRLSDYFDPSLRSTNPESYYVGLALLALSVASLWVYRRQRGFTTALTLTGCFGILITTTGFNQLFNALPLNNLLWPLRFLGIASFVLLLALMWSLQGWKSISPVVMVTVVAIIAIDGAGSFRLIKQHPIDPDVDQINQRLAVTNGWREATLDLSQLGSEPSYVFSVNGGREQLFGWAFQGAKTAKTLVALNEAIELGFPSYLISRLNLYGTDDVALFNELPEAADIAESLEWAGFVNIYSGKRTSLYHREGSPRAFIADWDALGIGIGAQNLAYLFPSLVIGTSTRIDDYNLEHLLRYKTVVLSGFDWHDKGRAEQLIEQVARNGVRVVVDLSGVKEDPLARIPRFLNVWGEKVILSPGPVQVSSLGNDYQLERFNQYSYLWKSHMLQGIEQEFWSFDYLGEKATLVGYNSYGPGKVWFVGLNLPYHAVQTRDPLAIQLLSLLLQSEPEIVEEYAQVPLLDYHAGGGGYQFWYYLDNPQVLFVPIAHHDGTFVLVDGIPTKTYSYERLLAFEAPAGVHQVKVGLHRTATHTVGKLFSGLGLLILFGVVMAHRRKQVGP